MNVSIAVSEDETILDAASEADVPLEHACGGNCACATCHVFIEQGETGLEERSEQEQEMLKELGPVKAAQCRLACQTYADCDLVVKVPGLA